MTRTSPVIVAAVTLLLFLPSYLAADQVRLVVGKDAPELERFAAHEVASQFARLFDVEITVADDDFPGGKHVILIGSPATNKVVRKVAGHDWPNLSDQGIVLRSFNHDGSSGLVVGGGSPVAILWAAYELGYRFGIRYLLRGDIFPPGTRPMKLDNIDVVMEPTLRSRTWRTVDDFAIGPESWGLAQHKIVLGQLAKMKFNRVMLSFYPWHPFVHYEFAGVKKKTAMLWFGEEFPILRDMPGGNVFGDAKLFYNPDLAGKNSYEALTAAGIELIRGIMREARRLGMKVAISIRPAEFTHEFAAALPGLKSVNQLNNLTIGPAAKHGPNDATLKKLVAAKIRAYINTYPALDAICIGLPEFPEWDEHVESAWEDLSADGRLGDLTLGQLTETAAKRNLIASGDRGVRALRGNIAPLAFFKSLFSDRDLLTRPDGGQVELVIRQIDTALYPVLEQVIPEGASTLNAVDYTARRIVANRKYLADVPAAKVKSSLILTLADDNVGILSQSARKNIHELVSDLRKYGWDGFSTRYWMLAELDPTVHYLSRASFDSEVTPRSSHDDLFATITANPGVSDRLWTAFNHIEAATNLIDQHHIGFGFPIPGMMMKHYRAGPDPAWWAEVKNHYEQAAIELRRALVNTDPGAKQLLFYYAKRGEYVIDYLNCVEAVRKSATAKKEGDLDAALEKLDSAVEKLYDAIDSLSDVVRDECDRGLIALLNTFAYRPLVDERERVAREVASSAR